MATRLLCELLAHSTPISTSRFAGNSDYLKLRDAGLVVEGGVVETVLCDRCENEHSAALVYEEGSYGYFCHELGLVELSERDIGATKVDHAYFVSMLADALGATHRRSKPIDGHTWRVGRVQSDSAELAVYFHPMLKHADDLRSLSAALSRETKFATRIVLTAEAMLPVESATVVSLLDVLSVVESGDLAFSANLFEIAGIKKARKGGRPGVYKQQIYDLIRSRAANGISESSINAERKAIQAALRDPETDTGPSEALIKKYIREYREGQKGVKN